MKNYDMSGRNQVSRPNREDGAAIALKYLPPASWEARSRAALTTSKLAINRSVISLDNSPLSAFSCRMALTFSSGMPWLLNIHADWSAVTATNSRAEVTVIVYADHYSLHYNSFENLAIRLGDESHRMYASEIQSDINQPQSTELGRYT